MSAVEIEWGPDTPESVKIAIGEDPQLREAINECLSEQGHPTNLDLFPRCSEILNAVTPEEMDKLVDQGRV